MNFIGIAAADELDALNTAGDFEPTIEVDTVALDATIDALEAARTLVAALSRAHVVGDPVIPFGGSFVTGTGKQGTPVGDGTADRYTGSDGTHPTVAGHANIARTVFELLAATIPA